MKQRVCIVCGCTEDRACIGPGGPCGWVARRPDMCSGCLVFLMNIRDPARLVALANFFGIAGADLLARYNAAPCVTGPDDRRQEASPRKRRLRPKARGLRP